MILTIPKFQNKELIRQYFDLTLKRTSQFLVSVVAVQLEVGRYTVCTAEFVWVQILRAF